MDKKNNKKKKRLTLNKVIGVTALYILLFATIFSFLDYYAYLIFNPYLLTILSVVLGVITTYLHFKIGKRTTVDELADKL